jgi:hypothetical protein
VNGCVGRVPSALLFPGAYNDVKTAMSRGQGMTVADLAVSVGFF